MPVAQELSIHVQNACNSDCTFCIVDASIHTLAIPREEIEAFLDENQADKMAYVNFHGGEPTMRGDLAEIVASVRARGLGSTVISVQTNGRRLSDAAYARTLVDAGVNHFVISMHGHTAEIQDETSRRPGSFVQAAQGIRNVRALGCKVQTNSVIAKNNVRFLAELIDLLADLDVTTINISALHTASEAVESVFEAIVPTYVELRPYLLQAVARAEQHKIPVILEGFPMCVYPERLEYHLTRPERKIRMYFRGHTIQNYDDLMDRVHRRHVDACDGCIFKSRCGGVYVEYLQHRGDAEFGAEDRLGTWGVTHGSPGPNARISSGGTPT